MASSRGKIFNTFVIILPLLTGVVGNRRAKRRRRRRRNYRKRRSPIIRRSRTYRHWKPTYYYYKYYKLYSSYPYSVGYYAYKNGDRKGANVCKNYEYMDNGTYLGQFTCPMPFEPSDFKFCCGKTDVQYCCRYLDSESGRSQVTALGVVFGILTVWIAHIIRLIYKDKKAKANAKAAGNNTANQNESSGATQNGNAAAAQNLNQGAVQNGNANSTTAPAAQNTNRGPVVVSQISTPKGELKDLPQSTAKAVPHLPPPYTQPYMVDLPDIELPRTPPPEYEIREPPKYESVNLDVAALNNQVPRPITVREYDAGPITTDSPPSYEELDHDA